MCKNIWNADSGVWRVYYVQNTSSIVVNNRRIAIREVADEVGISFGSYQAIVTDVLGMKHAAAKIVLKWLNFDRKQRRMDIAQEMLTTFNDDPDLLKKVITVPLNGFKEGRKDVNDDACRCTSTVNKEFYLEVMLRLRQTIRQKGTELRKNHS